jgi:uncharacterized delta-60 repeat protein
MNVTLSRGRKQLVKKPRVKRPFKTTRPRLERLEDRLALSGFGPEDGAYILESRGGSYESVKIAGGDQIIAAGGAGNIARYDAQGNVDATFGSGGIADAQVSDGIYGAGAPLSVQSDGKLVMGGAVNWPQKIAAGRLNANGTPDTTFGGSGVSAPLDTNSSLQKAYASAVQSSGRIVVAGESGNSAVVARFTSTGAVDSGKGAFGQTVKGKPAGYTLSGFGGKYDQFWGMAVQPDDKIVAVGISDTTGNGDDRLVVARYTASGTLDTSFNRTGYSLFLPAGFSHAEGKAVAIQSDGRIVVAGYSTGIDGFSDMLVARFNTNGSLDTSFGGGSGYTRLDIDGTASTTIEHAYGIAIQPDGRIVASGWEAEAPYVDGSPDNVLVARFNADGSRDTTFGGAGFKLGAVPTDRRFHGTGVALQSDGSIIVAGNDNPLSGPADPHPFIMRFYGDNAPASTSTSTATPSTADATDAALMYLLTDPSLPGNKRN